MLLLFSGIVIASKPVQYIGVIMIFISWLTTSAVSWKKGVTNFKKSTALVLLGLIGIIAYAAYI
ncbi:hypothetical protein [Oceanobacillus neutriphilus]|uniref:Uncharacterized protein n=1 Tax=Oceanobacillus neutriphilus TaxID=531815 RepID=A0ABQ2P1Y1_9BACI|nr:hypothetical protein [Oceanobacillus neutriphilus]GGP16111.1 hypothetical protein GCM10011346_46780 [Oceanobacillus neutriphilus]